jgi:predicted Zn-dependent protease
VASPLVAALLLAAGAARPQSKTAPPAAASAGLDVLTRRADAAREAGRVDEAMVLYREALVREPDWAEGWWYLGSMAYDRDRFAVCRDAFGRLVALEPKGGPGWAVMGLCEFHLGEYASSRRHLEQALALGVPREDLGPVVLYHHALLLVRDSQFDLAIAPLTQILRQQAETRELFDACGLVLLRRATLPSAIPSRDRDLVMSAGQAYCALLARHTNAAQTRFEALLSRYPRERHLHYGYGLLLAQLGSAGAEAQFRREIEIDPDAVLARVELVFQLLTRNRPADAREPAEKAVALAPGLFVSHLALGRVLVAVGELARGIGEIERAARLAPEIPEIQLTLARAYAQAGRKADADRASAAFQSLQAARKKPADPARGPDGTR